jgi:hypothetical protein
MTIINSAVKAYYTAAGTYTENVDGLAVVKVPGVVLKDVVISGNLIAAEGIASGDLTLDGKTEVKGKLIVRGAEKTPSSSRKCRCFIHRSFQGRRQGENLLLMEP